MGKSIVVAVVGSSIAGVLLVPPAAAQASTPFGVHAAPKAVGKAITKKFGPSRSKLPPGERWYFVSANHSRRYVAMRSTFLDGWTVYHRSAGTWSLLRSFDDCSMSYRDMKEELPKAVARDFCRPGKN